MYTATCSASDIPVSYSNKWRVEFHLIASAKAAKPKVVRVNIPPATADQLACDAVKYNDSIKRHETI